jgi:hypothetical protein
MEALLRLVRRAGDQILLVEDHLARAKAAAPAAPPA